jgi:hypothetical protein
MGRLQAPDVEQHGGEFRIYAVDGELNLLQGQITKAGDDRAGVSSLTTDQTWDGDRDALSGEWVRVNGTYFQVKGNTTGANFEFAVLNLKGPDEAPTTGPFTLAYSSGKPYHTDYKETTNWGKRLHVEPAGGIPLVTGQIAGISGAPGGDLLVVATDRMLADPDGVLTPGVLVSNEIAYQAKSHELNGGLSVHVAPQEIPTDPPHDPPAIVKPQAGAEFFYLPGKRYTAYVAGFDLAPEGGSGTASAHVAVSTSDGSPHTSDDPRWTQTGRGGLGGRNGNEGDTSPAQKVMAVKRTLPGAPGDVPLATGTPIFAQPADFHGQARYTLGWEPAPDAAEYAVYRCSGAALYGVDLAGRKEGRGYYASHDPFADDAGFGDWLAETYPELTADNMKPQAWQAWAARFYASLSDAEVQALADREGNEAAFRRVNQETVTGTTYTDRFDGRGQGIYLYRVQAIDAAGNLSQWADSHTYPPVHIYDVTPPASPVVTSILGGDRSLTITWQANREADLHAYRIWRAESEEELADIRRVPPTTEVLPANGEVEESWTDTGLAAMTDYYYRLAALDENGNVSLPTKVMQARVYDTYVPPPPTWNPPQIDTASNTAQLTWTHDDASLSCLVQRRVPNISSWVSASDWLARGQYEFTDSDRYEPAYEYRLLVMDEAGRRNSEYETVTA